MSLPKKNPFNPVLKIADSSGNPTQQFRDYMRLLDALVTAMATGGLGNLVNAPNDAAAKLQGVAIDAMYRNGSVLMVRVN